MTILDTIEHSKRGEIARAKRRLPLELLQDLCKGTSPARGFARALQSQPGPRVIAEVKRASPSRGVLRPHDAPGTFVPEKLAQAYERGGAAALSVLTDVHFFWGHPDALLACRDATSLAVLRKDFILDPYQVYESRLLGADAILLIARMLDDVQLRRLADLAVELGMDVLLEVHDEAEIARALAVPGAIIGVNNRDLATFKTDLGRSARLRRLIPNDTVVVAESGLHEPAHLRDLQEQGIAAFLIGEHLAKNDDPAAELRRLIGA